LKALLGAYIYCIIQAITDLSHEVSSVTFSPIFSFYFFGGRERGNSTKGGQRATLNNNTEKTEAKTKLNVQYSTRKI
jgi:hypothetical protein